MNEASRRPLPLLLTATVGTVCLVGSMAAQVRLGVRPPPHLDSLRADGFPVEVNDFASGDVDGDGDLDLIGCGEATWLWRNDGDGVFVRSNLGAADSKSLAALFDADGDGDLDLFLAGGRRTYPGAGTCELLLNDGHGSFGPGGGLPQPLGGLETVSLGVADVDGDGDQDLVLCPHLSPLLCWRNDGTGSFTDDSATMLPGVPWSSGRGRVADVDGDGDVDILANDGYQLLRNDGSGVFTTVAGFQQPFLEVADLDDDGDPDLIDAGVVRRNDGGLAFTAVGSVPFSFAIPGGAERIAVADVDGDGRRDLVGMGPALPRVLRNTGNLVFVDATTSWFTGDALVDRTVGYAFGACALVDIDGDGDPDLVTGGSEGRPMSSTTVGIPPSLFVNREGARFAQVNRPCMPWVQQTAAAVVAGDVDGDGDVDLIVSGLGHLAGNAEVTLWQQDEAGRFLERSASLMNWSSSAAALVDVDGDGDLDLFGVHGAGPFRYTAPDRHRLALNDGAGNFTDVTASHLPMVLSTGASCAAGDVDGDGDVDLVVGSYDLVAAQGAPLLLLRNDGTGHFADASSQLPSTPIDADGLALRDFDGDGDLDLAIAVANLLSPTHGTLLYRNAGGGAFVDVTTTHLPASIPGRGVAVSDLDGDGDDDLAQDGGSLLNDGHGVFTSAAGVPGRLLAADFDGDGVVDDVVGGSNGLRVGGTGIPFGWGVLGHRVLAIDIDRDADLDLVVASIDGFGAPNPSITPFGVLHNFQRDLRPLSQPRPGRPWRLAVQADSGGAPTVAFVAVAPGLLTQRVLFPGLGELALDPSALALLGFAVLPDGAATASFAMSLPAMPRWNDLPLAAQALFVPVGGPRPARLSNALALRITP